MRYKELGLGVREFKGSLIKDISEGGMSMRSYEFLPLNRRLAMEIPLQRGFGSVQGTCRVNWIKKVPFGEQYDVGLEFVSLNHEDLTQVAKFVFNKSIEKVL